jgi:hypothetical protein
VYNRDVAKELVMETDFNVDVICNDTGEILQEGVLFASAHIYIAKRDGKVVKDEVVPWPDGPGVDESMEVRNLWVEIPEIQEDIRKWERDRYNARKFWQYENDFGQERK